MFLSNKFENPADVIAALPSQGDKKFGKEFTILDIDSANIQKGRMSQGNNNNINKKQAETKMSTQRAEAALVESKKDIENNIKTFITHNKGGAWELIKAP